MPRIVGTALLLAALAIAGIGVLWITLAIIGREWDYCPSGECIAGEIIGAVLAGIGAAIGWAAIQLVRYK